MPDRRRIYLDGNSLDPPGPDTADARLLGAASGQVMVGDSTTVMWFKAVGAWRAWLDGYVAMP